MHATAILASPIFWSIYGFFALICFIVVLAVLREKMVEEEGSEKSAVLSRIAGWAFLIGFATVGGVCWPLVVVDCYMKSLGYKR